MQQRTWQALNTPGSHYLRVLSYDLFLKEQIVMSIDIRTKCKFRCIQAKNEPSDVLSNQPIKWPTISLSNLQCNQGISPPAREHRNNSSRDITAYIPFGLSPMTLPRFLELLALASQSTRVCSCPCFQTLSNLSISRYLPVFRLSLLVTHSRLYVAFA